MEQNQNPFEEINPKFTEAIDRYNEDKNDFYSHVQLLSDNPGDTDEQDLTDVHVHNLARSFTKACTVIRESASDFDEAKERLVRFWTLDDSERVYKLRDITNTEVYQYFDTDEVEEVVDDLIARSDNGDQLEEYTMVLYKRYLRSDMNIFYGQTIHPADNGSEEYDHIFEQGPAVQALLQNLEKLANDYSPDYRDKLDDGCSFAHTTTELNGEMSSSFYFDVERAREIEDDGNRTEVLQYTIKTNLRRFYDGYISLPQYLKDHIQTLTEDPQSGFPFSNDDLIDETTIVNVDFNYNISASNDGSFWYYYGLELFINGYELSIPDDENWPAAEGDSIQDKVSTMSPEEKELLGTIFTDDEIVQLHDITQEAETKPESEDVINAFRKNMAIFTFEGTQQHIERAQSLVKELKRIRQKH